MEKSAIPLRTIIALCMILTACTSIETTGTTISNLGGDRLPVQLPDETYPHTVRVVEGSLTLKSNGCWFIDLGDEESLVIFPAGYTKPSSDGSVMVGPGEVVLRSGAHIVAQGGFIETDLLSGGPDGFWGGYIDFCSPEAKQMIVLDSLEVVGRLDS